jgi:hypothetical protein
METFNGILDIKSIMKLAKSVIEALKTVVTVKENPNYAKCWHLARYAKKARVRKKNRKRIIKVEEKLTAEIRRAYE